MVEVKRGAVKEGETKETWGKASKRIFENELPEMRRQITCTFVGAVCMSY